MVREVPRGVEMMQRSMDPRQRLREGFEALQAGRFEEARDAVAPLRGTAAGALLHGLADAGAGNVVAGAAVLHGVWRTNPGARHPVLDLVELLQRAGREREVGGHLRAALHHAPDEATLLTALAAVLAEDGGLEEGIAVFVRLAGLRPGDAAAQANAQSNLGKALAAAGRFEEAEVAFARCGTGDPQRELNHAVARLKSGRLVDGWGLFRARHRLPGRAAGPPGRELRRLEEVAGRSVLLLHDEGFGDTIQFIRYVPMLREAGARVAVLAPPPLLRLLRAQGLDAVERWPSGFDTWCRIPDLPGVFGTTLDSIPGTLPYIRPDAGLVAVWRKRLPPGRRVGLVWAGAARAGNPAAVATDRVRSLPQDRLGPLLAVEGVTWVSLQRDGRAPAGVFDPMAGVADFADTAAIVASLDLVVSVDTAVAHLVAASGTPVVMLDRFDNCWRWLHGREDSPWYPGVLRIVRQAAPGDWDGVLARAAALVRDAMAAGGCTNGGIG